MTAPDIKKKLPREGDEFDKVDKTWRKEVIGKIYNKRKVIEFC